MAKNDSTCNQGLGEELGLREKERTDYWRGSDRFIGFRVKWRASVARHLFHLLPEQRILEIGSGDGRFTEALLEATRNECLITAVVFSEENKNILTEKFRDKNVRVVFLEDFPGALLKEEKFDFIVCYHMLPERLKDLFLVLIKALIKPGGGVLFFEANPWNPYLRLRRAIGLLFSKRARRRSLTNRINLLLMLSEAGYVNVNALPYDFLYPPIPKFLLWPAKNISIIMENFPYLRNFAGSLYIWARNPSPENSGNHFVDLSEHSEFFNKVSFVIPCHNEEMNIGAIVESIHGFYGKYVYEVILVDDNSTDKTTQVAESIMRVYPKTRLIKRSPPNGVGRALRDGLSYASGEFIVIMDSDFQHLIPEMRDLFDAIARGADVAIGSRFSPNSVVINYAFTKIVANRAFHILANLLFWKRFRDITNNLKIFRKETAKRLIIESDDFAANAETGLKPILLGYNVEEVPISWVNRSANMGFSTFRILNTGPNYFKFLFRASFRKLAGKKGYAG